MGLDLPRRAWRRPGALSGSGPMTFMAGTGRRRRRALACPPRRRPGALDANRSSRSGRVRCPSAARSSPRPHARVPRPGLLRRGRRRARPCRGGPRQPRAPGAQGRRPRARDGPVPAQRPGGRATSRRAAPRHRWRRGRTWSFRGQGVPPPVLTPGRAHVTPTDVLHRARPRDGVGRAEGSRDPGTSPTAASTAGSRRFLIAWGHQHGGTSRRGRRREAAGPRVASRRAKRPAMCRHDSSSWCRRDPQRSPNTCGARIAAMTSQRFRGRVIEGECLHSRRWQSQDRFR